MDDNVGSFDYQLSLRIWHPSLSPAAISQALSRTADAGWAVGDSHTLLDGTPSRRAQTYWSHRVHVRADTPLSETLRRECALLMTHSDFLSAVADTGGRAEMFVGWFSGRNSGEVFPRDLLGALAGLHTDLSLDVYSEECAAPEASAKDETLPG